MKQPPWKVGELASRTGMSVRALHHYDEIGLLTPSLRTPSGHRLYQDADVARLQQIQSLRLMGIPLDEVKRLLDGAAMTPREVLDLHLARLHEQIARQNRLAERIETLATHMDRRESASIDDLCQIIQAMTTMEKYFTPEQLEVLRDKRTSITQQHMDEVRDSWNEIIPKVRHAMAANADPTSPEIVAIAKRWKELVEEFTGGDPKIAQAVKTMYENEGPTLQQQLGEVPTPEMFVYISKAFAAMKQ
ncbi:MAG TPA: MerR family transcriptional regulator [Gemmatimonadaceae bacterium]|nr:MerR family transcriptional regulator [Gemmatimonadaceae bacterium]